MDFALDDDQTTIKALAERFVADRYAPGARAGYRAQPGAYSSANWALLADLGVLSIPFAEADGGLGGGLVEVATVMEALGRGLVCEPLLAEVVLGAGLIAQAGTPSQRDAWIERVIAGAAHVGFAFAEQQARYDLERVETRMEGGRLYGAKTAVEGGRDAYVVTAREEGALRLCLIAGDAAGIERREYRLVDGAVAQELTFDAVPADAMQGGIEALDIVVDRARVAASADMVGAMGALFDATLAYVRQRRQFGAPIGSFQAIQHRLADQYAALEQARSQLYAAFAGDRTAIAAAKSAISTSAVSLGEACIQFHGGMGVSDELDIGHWHKRILRLGSLFGDAAYEQKRYDQLRRRGL